MFEEYQKFTVFIYYTKNQEPFLHWSKIYWLMKTAHPIKFLYLENVDHTSFELLDWIKLNAPNFSPSYGLLIPATIRPIVEIDFLQEQDKANKVAICKDGSIIFCINDPSESNFKSVEISCVFEDFSLPESHYRIFDEIDILKNQLNLNL